MISNAVLIHLKDRSKGIAEYMAVNNDNVCPVVEININDELISFSEYDFTDYIELIKPIIGMINDLVDKKYFEEYKCKSYEEYIIKQCAHRAYRDLSRTLKFNDNVDHKIFENSMCDFIVCKIKKQMIENKIIKNEDFDQVHKDICELLIGKNCEKVKNLLEKYLKINKSKERNKQERLYYGQAQKWLNMTLKYMWLLGLWENEILLHVPIDSYIIESVWGTEGITLPLKEGKNRSGNYSPEKVLAWSQWDYTEYDDFQKKLRANKKERPLIEYEGQAWLKIAEKRRT